MKVFVIYLLISVIGYFVMQRLYKTGRVTALPCVKNKWLYYLLQFTWGFVINFFGALTAAALILCGHKPEKHGYNWYFRITKGSGFSMGIFVIAPKEPTEHLIRHEHGHSIQNIYMGPFVLTMVYLPSVTRFWWREYQMYKGLPLTTNYDDAWFEGQASATGDLLFSEIM